MTDELQVCGERYKLRACTSTNADHSAGEGGLHGRGGQGQFLGILVEISRL